MNYQEVCSKQLSNQQEIISSICSIRDTFNKDTVERKFFQEMIALVSVLKTDLEANYMRSQIDEFKK